MECLDRPEYLKDCPPYKIIHLQDRITVIGDIYQPCSSKFRCNLAYASCDSIFSKKFFNAGVIINAKSILIQDPEFFESSPPIIFEFDSSGNMIRRVIRKKD